MISFIERMNPIIYTNFESLLNNIRNHDKNINASFRIVAESLLKHINSNSYIVEKKWNIKSSKLNYGMFFQSEKIWDILSYYRIDSKIFRILKDIQEKGNSSIHDDSIVKLFDYKDAKEKFKYLLLVAIRIYEKDFNELIDYTVNGINDYFDEIYNNDNLVIEESIDDKISIDDLVKMDEELVAIFKEVNNKEKFYCYDNLIKINRLIGGVIDYVKVTENLHDTKSFEKLGFGKIIEFYNFLKSIMDSNSFDDVESLIYTFDDKLYDIRGILENRYDVELFNWLFIKLMDYTFEENISNFEKIALRIEKVPFDLDSPLEEGRYYVTKRKVFIVNYKKYYEFELTKAVDYGSKFDRKIVYSKNDMLTNYSVKISYVRANYEFLGEDTEILILNNWLVSIRPCELIHYSFITLGTEFTISTEGKEKNSFYNLLNSYLTENMCNLLDIVLSDQEDYECFIQYINDNKIGARTFINALNISREIILSEKDGCNVLRYLLYSFRNKVIKNQKSSKCCRFLSDLYLNIGCKQFDKSPLSANLIGHVNNYYNIVHSINLSHRLCESFAHKIDSICIENQRLFVNLDELNGFGNVEELVNEYNRILSDNAKSYNRRLMIKDNYVYINNEVEQAIQILDLFEAMTKQKDDNYVNLLDSSKVLDDVDDDDKRKLLLNVFSNSKVGIICGEAGSGKTKVLTEYFSKIFCDKSIAYVANTHNAKNNLKRRIKKFYNNSIPGNIKFFTVKEFKNFCINISVDENVLPEVLLVDEAKVISNADILEILKYSNEFKYVIFSGDISQLEAIKLGNWFDLSVKMLNVKNELTTVFRSEDKELKELWSKVRNHDENVMKYIEDNNYSSIISDDVFEPICDDEIILCLNYGGMYGINRVNSYFQERNKNSKEYIWGLDKYKVGDPVLFNDFATNKYNGVLYNNLKGEIKAINKGSYQGKEYLEFTLKVYECISKEEAVLNRLYWESGTDEWTIITLAVAKHIDKDNDDDKDDAVVPFDIAYASSIHKAQGLQYDSVKIIITPESDKMITNSIFYTAITRAKKKLKIYWTEGKQKEMLDIISSKDENVDVEYLNKIRRGL